MAERSKPKKSKNDLFRSAIGFYLKQKNYVGTEKYRKSELLLLQNKKQFVLQKMLESDVQEENSFAYSNMLCLTNNNHHIVDQQFGRFVQFVDSQSGIMRTELKRFVNPLLCHLYLELLKACEPKAAIDFLRKYAHLVGPVETYDAPLQHKTNGGIVNADSQLETTQTYIRFARDLPMGEDPDGEYFMNLVQTLSTCLNMEHAENESEVVHFRSSKFEIHTTSAVADALKIYLERRGHVIILTQFYTWIYVNIVDNDVEQLTEDSIFLGSDREDDEIEDVKPNITLLSEKMPTKRPALEDIQEVHIKTEIDESDDGEIKGRERTIQSQLQVMEETKEKILNSQIFIPNFIKITDRGKGLTSAHMDANECHLVAGFNSSIVQLWQMNQNTCREKHLYRSFANSLCPWEVNNCQKEEEDEIENDIKTHAQATCDRLKEKYYEGKYEDNSFNEYGGIQLRGHGLGVTQVRFSDHYPLIYSVSKDTTMRCWRAENFTCGGIYYGHSYPIWCFDESPLGMYVATGSRDLTARLWSLERDYPLVTYVGHSKDVDCIAFHPNGNYLATGSNDLSVRLWCVTSGKLMRVFSDCKQPVSSIAFSPDGKFLAAGGDESKIRIFDLVAGSQLSELKDHSNSVTHIAWSKNGQHVASVCRDGSLRLWEIKKFLAAHESNNSVNSSTSSSSSSSSSSANRLLSMNGNCSRCIKVFFGRNNTICSIGN